MNKTIKLLAYTFGPLFLGTEVSAGLPTSLPASLMDYSKTWKNFHPDNDETIWFTDKATGDASETSSFLLGNGSLGVCLSGCNGNYKLALNEKTCFEGTPTSNDGAYKGIGTLSITNNSAIKANSDFVHQLDLSTANYTAISHNGDYIFSAEAFASFPDQVAAMRFTANREKSISMTFSLDGSTVSVNGTQAEGTSNGSLSFSSYSIHYAVIAEGGQVTASRENISVNEADAVCLYLAASSNVNPENPSVLLDELTPEMIASGRISNAVEKGWDDISATHSEDYRDLYGTMSLTLDGQSNDLPTDRLQSGYDTGTLSEGQSRMYEGLVFAFGRYLAIASSRPYRNGVGINAPSNLQGLWAPKGGMWNCDIHADINVQMNYWPCEVTNISETHLPLLRWLIAMSKTDGWKKLSDECWRVKTGEGYDYYNGPSNVLNYSWNYGNLDDSRKEYIKDGWTCKATLNPFGGATSDYYYKEGGSPADKRYHSAQAWLCSHLIQHYLFTLDEDFLQEALPTLWGACRFWAQWLHRVNNDDGTYTYEAPYEVSPEQDGTGWGDPFYRSGATAHAQQLVTYLFKNTIDFINHSGLPAGASQNQFDEFKEIFSHLDNGLHTMTIDGKDYLREWKYLETFGIENHRHLSHLVAMYPLGQVTEGDAMMLPTINAMEKRGLGVGDADPAVWTTAWKTALWARAASVGGYRHQAGDIFRSTIGHYQKAPAGTGLHENLTSYNQCMQMEGNWGLTAAVAEMLLQSHAGYIDILPALPSYWPAGKVRGLKALGNFDVDIEWAESMPLKVEITSQKGAPISIKRELLESMYAYIDGIIYDPEEEEAMTASANQHNDNSPETISIPLSRGQSLVLSSRPISGGATTSIESIQTSRLAITVDGRKVSISGDVRKVEIFNLQGMNFKPKGNLHEFEIPLSAGKVVLIRAIDSHGQSSVRKVNVK